MSESQTNSDQSDEPTDDQSVISPQAREEIRALVHSQVEAALDRADPATQDDLQSVNEAVSGEVDGLRSDIEGLRSDFNTLQNDTLTEEEISELCQSYALSGLSHLIQGECDNEEHERLRRALGLTDDNDQAREQAQEQAEDEDTELEQEVRQDDIYGPENPSPWGNSD